MRAAGSGRTGWSSGMFTGLIEDVGTVAGVENAADASRIRFLSRLAPELRPGDSVSVSGVCLTVVTPDAAGFAVDVSAETLRVTTIGGWQTGRRVNLERALRADSRLGGHFVQGHVDGVGVTAAFESEGDAAWLDIEVPAALAPFVVPKGSIAIDGVSLTVATLEGRRAGIQLVPFTIAHTALGSLAAGAPVNVEADLVGKYVARLLEARLGRTEAATP